MKNTLFLLLSVLFLYSCATTNEKINLYTIYKEFISKTNKNEYKSALNMLSQKNKVSFLKKSSIEKFKTHFPVLSSLHTIIIKEDQHFQSIKKNKSCFTISGIDSSQEPTSINFEFVKEGEFWKINYVQVMYHGSSSEYPNKATCPTKL